MLFLFLFTLLFIPSELGSVPLRYRGSCVRCAIKMLQQKSKNSIAVNPPVTLAMILTKIRHICESSTMSVQAFLAFVMFFPTVLAFSAFGCFLIDFLVCGAPLVILFVQLFFHQVNFYMANLL